MKEPETRLVNLTPHPVTVLDHEDQPIFTLEISGSVARVSRHSLVRRETLWDGSEVRVAELSVGRPVGLPAERDGVLLVVSRLVADATPGRRDLLVPHPVIRREGRVLGCRGFAQRISA